MAKVLTIIDVQVNALDQGIKLIYGKVILKIKLGLIEGNPTFFRISEQKAIS